jgi:hypothetical protein
MNRVARNSPTRDEIVTKSHLLHSNYRLDQLAPDQDSHTLLRYLGDTIPYPVGDQRPRHLSTIYNRHNIVYPTA